MIKVSIYKENIIILKVHASDIKTCQIERKSNGSIIFYGYIFKNLNKK